jgi:phosphate starvation-inducible PhoH-like protein
LTHAKEVLDDVAGITFTEFGNKDVVRHPVVQRVVSAYEAHEKANQSGSSEGPT